MNLIFDAPINNLSFGNVAVNLLKELYKTKAKLCLFPKTDTSLEAFDKTTDSFKGWVNNGSLYKYHNINKELPSLNLWHINGSEKRLSPKQHLLTFYELDSPTFVEKKLIDMQDTVFLSNPTAIKAFEELGCKNIKYVPLGFDQDFKTLDASSKIVEGKNSLYINGEV